ncbi:MAG: diguanylate cyclase [bacterium]|nr:diguanylate cyclase [bacterium]
MNEKPIKVLLVEDDLEDIALFEEALIEIEEGLYTRRWMKACEFVPVDRASDALEVLGEERFDVILLDTTLPDGHGLYALLRIQAAAPDVPIVVLAATDDEPLAISLVRQGAQDYLIKSELDCVPLARSLRCAIERHRVRSALRSLTLLDDLTGLYSWGGFHNLAGRHARLAREMNRNVRLFLIDLAGLDQILDTFGTQERDMTLILTADILRDTFRQTDIIARQTASRFWVMAIESGADRRRDIEANLKRRLDQANTRRGGRCPLELRMGTAALAPEAGASLEHLLEAAEVALCENGRSTARAAG